MPYGQVPHAEKHGVRIGLDISAVVFVIHLTKIKVKKIHPWVLWLEAYIPIMGWLTYQYYMTGAYKNKKQTIQGGILFKEIRYLLFCLLEPNGWNNAFVQS